MSNSGDFCLSKGWQFNLEQFGVVNWSNRGGLLASDFVLHQMKSCVDYSYDSYLISSLCSFLNYQTYHHLFPNVSHFHFLSVRKDIDEVISEYHNIQTSGFVTIIKKYFQYLWLNSFDNTIKKNPPPKKVSMEQVCSTRRSRRQRNVRRWS